MSKIVACLACRNNSNRLYGKPLQNLGNNYSVLDHIVKQLRSNSSISDIVLAISENSGNEVFIQYAQKNNLKYVTGDDRDVLGRLIKACKAANGETVFRMTSESPFPYLEGLEAAISSHNELKSDYTTYAKLPDGGLFELIQLSALEKSHRDGCDKHRSELCTLYINENKDLFTLNILTPPLEHQAPYLRLTIDYPEDLIFCRRLYSQFPNKNYIKYSDIFRWLKSNPHEKDILTSLEDDDYVRPYY